MQYLGFASYNSFKLIPRLFCHWLNLVAGGSGMEEQNLSTLTLGAMSCKQMPAENCVSKQNATGDAQYKY